MFEKDNNPEAKTYNSKLEDFSRFADQIMLTQRRSQFRQYAIETDYADCGLWFDIDDDAINNFCMSKLLNPVTGIQISAYGDADCDTEISKRTFAATIKSRELNQYYRIFCNYNWYGEVMATKSAERIYGVPDVDRSGMLIAGSAMLEEVDCENTITDDELELLYMILDYINRNNMATPPM